MVASIPGHQRVAKEKMMPVKVRPVEEGDTEAVAALVEQLRYEVTVADVAERLAGVAADQEAEVLVAESDGMIVGWIHVYGVTWVQMGHFAGVAGMVVADGRRGEGIGSRLLEEAEAWARRRDYPLFRVRSNVIRDQAHAFYLQRGYRTEKQLFSFLKEL
jgi:GNAT superfamily N-acetyltransferase